MIIPVSGAPDISASDTITLQSFCIGYITIDSSDEVCRDIDSDAHTIIDEKERTGGDSNPRLAA